jgi:hypothetical protein
MGENTLYQIFELFIVIVEIYTVYLYQSECYLFNNRPRWQHIGAYAVFGAVLAGFSLWYPHMALLPLITFAGIFSVSVWCYQGHSLVHLVLSFLYLAIGIALEYLVALAQSAILGVDLQYIYAYGANRVIGALISKMTMLPIAKISAMMVGRRKALFARRMLKAVPLLLCQLFLVILLNVHFIASYHNESRLTGILLLEMVGIILVSAVILLYFDITVSTYESRRQQEEAAWRLDSQTKYYHAVKLNLDRLLALNHDVKKHASVLGHLIGEREYGKAADYIASFTDTFDVALTDGSKFIFNDHPVIGAILFERLYKAEALGAKIATEIVNPSMITLDHLDLTIMLGNTLDNALNALALLPEGAPRLLNVNLRQDERRFFYEIVNTCEAYSSQRIRQGYGLYNVETVVRKYGGKFSAERKGGQFTVAIAIFTRDAPSPT